MKNTHFEKATENGIDGGKKLWSAVKLLRLTR